MAKQTQQKQPLFVTCEVCNKQIYPDSGSQIPTAYVVTNGHNVCWDCVKAGAASQFKETTR